jgi:hypothetical protein
MVLRGDVFQVEAHFYLFGDYAHLGARKVYDMRRIILR